MQYVDYSVADRIATITLNRPDKRNALSRELITELKDSFRQAEGDDAVKVIILRAAGEAFCAGADIKELTGRSLDSARDRIDFWLALRGRELVS